MEMKEAKRSKTDYAFILLCVVILLIGVSPATVFAANRAVSFEETFKPVSYTHLPLVTAWQKLGCSQEDIEKLCDIAMDGDRGIAEEMGFDFKIISKIAEGADTCRIEFSKK